MTYTVQQLADLAGVSIRTLHYYDAIGLLNPARKAKNSYRFYEEADLLRLQQILFFRELEFPLGEIKTIVDDPNFRAEEALRDQYKMLQLKRKRTEGLLHSLEKTMKSLKKKKPLNEEQMFGDFSNKEVEKYAAEAKERWGHTDAYKQSQERVKKMTKADWKRIQNESGHFLTEIVKYMDKDPTSKEVQALIPLHYNSLRNFYEPNLEMYRGLGSMYVDDSRFAAYYEKVAPGLAVFMRDAMHTYCDNQEKKK